VSGILTFSGMAAPPAAAHAGIDPAVAAARQDLNLAVAARVWAESRLNTAEGARTALAVNADPAMKAKLDKAVDDATEILKSAMTTVAEAQRAVAEAQGTLREAQGTLREAQRAAAEAQRLVTEQGLHQMRIAGACVLNL